MEELSQAVAMTLSLGNSVCENSRIATQVEVTNLKLVTDRASLVLSPPTILPVDYVSGGNVNNPESEIDRPENRNGWIASDAVSQECREDEVLSPVGFSCGTYKDDDLLVFNTDSKQSLPTPVIQNTGNDQFIVKSINLDMPSARRESTVTGLCGEISDGSDVKLEAVASIVKNLSGTTRSVFEVECVPLWGSVCICGRRPEMEDAVADVPSSIQIPIKMLVGDHHAISRKNQSLSHLTGHFFGVYDGHGGSQVANYCRDRIHLVLTEEIETAGSDLSVGSTIENCKVQWEKVFMSCFGKVDDEVGGKVKRGITMGDTCISDAISGPLAPETVGSTAIVALICSSHLLVASCGDSRAVLCRGKEVVPLSVDHKPDREDEYARIEKSGGKVIQWNGYRVFGVLAMSRSIGDRYLKPWIIPDPEVMIVPRAREDECLILASDGLWDVMTNEEVCESARRRILWWHKKNGAVPVAERGKGVDPAAQAAAEYLSALALQRGSKDNISVIVVDLKAQRKFKNRTVG